MSDNIIFAGLLLLLFSIFAASAKCCFYVKPLNYEGLSSEDSSINSQRLTPPPNYDDIV